MNLKEYQEEARKTASKETKNLYYSCLGLVGELDEMEEAVKIAEYQKFELGYNHEDIFLDDIKKEVGDNLWNLSNLCTELKIGLTDIQEISTCMTVNENSPRAMKTTAAICETIKKIIRDKSSKPNKEDIEKLKYKFAALLAELEFISVFYTETNIEEIAKLNIEKLKSRQERGVLGGSGDNR